MNRGSHGVVVQVDTEKKLSKSVDVFSGGMKDVEDIPSASSGGSSSADPRSHALAFEWLDGTKGEPAAGMDTSDERQQMHFTSGRTQVVSGIVHVYRKASTIGAQSAEEVATQTALVLAVPSWMSTADFLNFVGPAHDSFTHVRVIRDGMPNRFMVLLKFSDISAAVAFHSDYNKRPFSSMETTCCQVVFVERVEFLSSGEFTSFPPEDAGLLELPTCPVCLERMDSSLSGVFTLLCNHTFHCKCLAKWGDSSCPVCRYGNDQGDHEHASECIECGVTNDLWMCLICGNVGCGRYGGGHAALHFRTSQHPFSIDLETQRVWDYVGDEYVHRLIANKADGKLVEFPASGNEPAGTQAMVPKDKLDQMAMDFGNLLTTQLESQRTYFQDEVSMAQTAAREQAAEAKRAWQLNESATSEVARLTEQLEASERERKAQEKKVTQLTTKYAAALKDLQEERAVASSMAANQEVLTAQLKERDARIVELEEQVRDVMFYLETQQRVGDSANKEEIQSGQVIMQAATPPKGKSPGRRKH